MKAKVREYDGDIKTNFLNNGLPKENTYYTFFYERYFKCKKTQTTASK